MQSTNTFESIIRAKNPNITDDDVKECVKFLKKTTPMVATKLFAKKTSDVLLKKAEDDLNQLIRNLRLAGYFDVCPRTRIVHEINEDERIKYLRIEYY